MGSLGSSLLCYQVSYSVNLFHFVLPVFPGFCSVHYHDGYDACFYEILVEVKLSDCNGGSTVEEAIDTPPNTDSDTHTY